MGGTSSKTISEQITNIITDTTVNDVQDCMAFVAQSQSLNIVGSGNITSGVSMVQSAQIDMNCYKQSKSITDLQQKIANKLQQSATSTSSGWPSLSIGTNAEAFSKMINNVVNTVNLNFVQNCASSANQSQSINVVGNRNITQSVAMGQTASIFKKCMTNTIANTTLNTDIQNYANQATTAESKNPFSFITDIFGGIFNSMMLIVGIVVLAVVWNSMSGGDSDYDGGPYYGAPQGPPQGAPYGPPSRG